MTIRLPDCLGQSHFGWGNNDLHYYKILARTGKYKSEVSLHQSYHLSYKHQLDDSRTSMPALARPCTSGVETSKHVQVTCWHCGCWDHYECVDNQYLSPYRIGGKWLPWFLRNSRPFIFKYRPLGPTYFNIWGIFTIVGIFLIKWYNIPLMQFASLTLEGAHP